MRFCRLSLRHESVRKIGRLVISLFRRFRITFCKDLECKLCSRWPWLRYRWNDKWSLWIIWVPIFSQRGDRQWKDVYCIVHVRFKKSCGKHVCFTLLLGPDHMEVGDPGRWGTSPIPWLRNTCLHMQPRGRGWGPKGNHLVAKQAHKQRTYRLFRWSCFSLQCRCCRQNLIPLISLTFRFHA